MRSAGIATIVFGVPLAIGLVEAIRVPGPSDAAHVDSRATFLWTILVTAFDRAGVDLALLERGLPILCWAGLLAVLVVHAARARIGPWHTVSEPEPPRDWVLRAPIAAWGVALHRSMQTQASNGSEIALFTLLAVGGLLWVANHPRQTGFAAALYALSVLARPEGWILSATAFAFAWWRGGWGRAWRFAAVWGVLLAPHVVWTFASNPRVTSAIGDPWVAPAAAYSRADPILILCALAGIAALIALARRRRTDPRSDVIRLALPQVAVVLLVAAPNVRRADAYFIATPILYLVAEEAARITSRRALVMALGILMVVVSR